MNLLSLAYKGLAENVGVLTREVFGLEVTHSGFHALIDSAVKASEGSNEAVLQHFGKSAWGGRASDRRRLHHLSGHPALIGQQNRK